MDRFHTIVRGFFSTQLPKSGNHLVSNSLISRTVQEEDDASQDSVDDGEDGIESHVL